MKSKVVMIQGTESDAGKSLVAAGLCRLYSRRGLKVFPFKSQNMGSNSYLTQAGDEISRAQVVQAEAAGRQPEVRMNPVLLKPLTDIGAEVIINGQPVAKMPASQYHEYKLELKPIIADIFAEIQAENDLVIIEGAGSPAEINLNDRDIVNMGMAEIADSPVLLVSDIDRGGVFASIYGTIALQTPEDRQRIQGIIINKFRGDINLLTDGLKMIEELTDVPVVGVIPYIDLPIDSEDSLALSHFPTVFDATKSIDIALLAIGSVSNFNDINSLTLHEDVSVRVVGRLEQLGTPDVLIIPTSESLEEMTELLLSSQLSQQLQTLVNDYQTTIIAFGAGGVALHESIKTPEGEVIAGLGLLPSTYVIQPESERYQVKFHWHKNSKPLTGHVSSQGHLLDLEKSNHWLWIDQINEESIQQPEGHRHPTLPVYHTSVHGLFDDLTATHEWLNMIRKEKGLPAVQAPTQTYAQFKDQVYDQLADHLEAHLDLQLLDQIINQGNEELE